MKRSCALLLALLYLVTSAGLAINLHYCGKLLTSVEINSPAKNCSKSAHKMKCCTEKQIQLKVKDAHQDTHFDFVARNIGFATAQPVTNFSYHAPSRVIISCIANKAPPDRHSVPAFLKNHSFRI